jgi:hypothetical protein
MSLNQGITNMEVDFNPDNDHKSVGPQTVPGAPTKQRLDQSNRRYGYHGNTARRLNFPIPNARNLGFYGASNASV